VPGSPFVRTGAAACRSAAGSDRHIEFGAGHLLKRTPRAVNNAVIGLVCSRCGGRQIDMIATGTKRR